jgi:hypothetical protein
MEMEMSNELRAYFESEAARPFVSAGNFAFDTAVARINEDDGRSFAAWLAQADEMVKTAVRAAYEAENGKNRALHAERLANARAAYHAELANGSSKTKSLKAAQKVYSRFEIKDAR